MIKTFRFDINGARISGELFGEGEAVIFLHAGVADKRMWHPQLEELSERCQTITYDRRGFGETETADVAFSHVEDLRELLDQLDISAASLVGCSQGGRVAIDFALSYPQRVTSLVLIAPAISGAPAPESVPPDIEALFEVLDEAEEADDVGLINEIEAHMWLDGPTSSAGRVGGELRDLFLEMNGIALVAPELTLEIETDDAYDRVADLTMTALALWGDLDFPHVKARCRYLVETIPSAEGVEISGTAHLPNLEKPEQINQLLRDFLD